MLGRIGNLAAAAVIAGFQAVFGNGVAAPAFHFMAVPVGIQQYRFGFLSLITRTDGIDPFAVFAGVAAAQQNAGFVVGNNIGGFERAVINAAAQVTAALVERVRAFDYFNRAGKLGIDTLAGSVQVAVAFVERIFFGIGQ